MKTATTLLIVLLCSFADINGQTIPNAGFENWTLVAGQYMNPDDWVTNATDFTNRVVREAPGHSGSYALQLNSTGFARSTFNFIQPPFSISAFVKTNIATNDSVKIQVFVYSGNNIVDTDEWLNTVSLTNWTPIQVSYTGNLTTVVDSVEIIITCGSVTGTSISVDEFSSEIPTGIGESINTNYIKVYPNPFSHQTSLQTDLILNNATLEIKNNMGQSVSRKNNISGNFFTIYRDNLPSGFYYIQLTQDNKLVSITKIIITE